MTNDTVTSSPGEDLGSTEYFFIAVSKLIFIALAACCCYFHQCEGRPLDIRKWASDVRKCKCDNQNILMILCCRWICSACQECKRDESRHVSRMNTPMPQVFTLSDEHFHVEGLPLDGISGFNDSSAQRAAPQTRIMPDRESSRSIPRQTSSHQPEGHEQEGHPPVGHQSEGLPPSYDSLFLSMDFHE